MNDNVYLPIDVARLRNTISKRSPVFKPGESSGFKVEDVDGEHATVVWQNVGTDETMHRDETESLSGRLNRSGYEVRLTKPANTTLIVRRVQPIVTHGAIVKENAMGTFELMVEQLLREDPKAEIKSALAGLTPAADSSYGRVWFHAESGKLRYSLSDGDQQDRYDEWDAAFKKIKGVTEVEGDAEIGAPKDGGWAEISESVFERAVESQEPKCRTCGSKMKKLKKPPRHASQHAKKNPDKFNFRHFRGGCAKRDCIYSFRKFNFFQFF